MKIELTKETRKNGKTWYCIRIDGLHEESFPTEIEGRTAFKYMVEKAQPEEIKEVLESFETEKIPQS